MYVCMTSLGGVFALTVFAVENQGNKRYECVHVSYVTQHANHMHGIVVSYVACPVLPSFSTLFHKRHDSGEKKLNIKCAF
jgi:hypothetical protein